MGREINRVPADFRFPLGGSYADVCWDQHRATCKLTDHDDCDYSISPPEGPCWQLWQTVSDGPISPVFETADELIDFMCQPDDNPEHLRWHASDPDPRYPSMPYEKGWRREVAEDFVRRQGWAPSMVIDSGRMMDGATAGYVLKDKK